MLQRVGQLSDGASRHRVSRSICPESGIFAIDVCRVMSHKATGCLNRSADRRVQLGNKHVSSCRFAKAGQSASTKLS
jgi:hypothetical protein